MALSALKAESRGLLPAPEPFFLRIHLEVTPEAFPVGMPQSLRALPSTDQEPTEDKLQDPVPQGGTRKKSGRAALC